MSLNYNGGTSFDPSGIDKAAANDQLQTFYWLKKSLIEARKEQYFLPLASTIGMPKHHGKKIKVLEYVPLLDDRNLNDQGIDAAGVTLDPTKFTVIFPELTRTFADNTAATAARAAVNAIEAGVAGGTGDEVVLTKLVLQNATQAQVTTLRVSYPDVKASPAAGNLYGSSKDVGTIVGKLPTLTENGGRV